MNVGKLLEVADLIEKSGRFDMHSFAYADGRWDWDIYPDEILHKCGTTACVAGWVNALGGRTLANTSAAGEDLGLTPEQAHELFIPSSEDPTVWCAVVGDGDPYMATAEQAARLLRMIASGEATFYGEEDYE